MADPSRTEPLRERTRRLIRLELSDLAQDLFVARGYEATTIDDIAAAAGMGRRTFFRYFASKEALILGKYDLFSEQMVQALRERPAHEPAWVSLRRILDVATAGLADPRQQLRTEAIERVVAASPTLAAARLERLSRMQAVLAAELSARLYATPMAGPAKTSLRARALVGAAFGCLNAAHVEWLEGGQQRLLHAVLDEAMAELTAR